MKINSSLTKTMVANGSATNLEQDNYYVMRQSNWANSVLLNPDGSTVERSLFQDVSTVIGSGSNLQQPESTKLIDKADCIPKSDDESVSQDPKKSNENLDQVVRADKCCLCNLI